MTKDARRVVITGVGTFGAAGSTVEALWKNVAAARPKVDLRFLPRIQTHLPVYAAGDPVFTTEDHRLTRRADRSTHLALAAAQEAWQDAKLGPESTDPVRVGLVIGSSRGPSGTSTATDNRHPKHATDSLYTTFSSAAGMIAASLQIQGCSLMVSATCISGAVAIKTALQMIDSGDLDAVLVGGVDAPLVDSLLEQFAATKVLSRESGPEALQPFGKHRSGTVLGEGAAFLVLESETSAQRRGAVIRGWVRHVAISCEPFSRAGGNENGEALRNVMQRSLRAADRSPREIDLVHVHGTGTHLNDRTESHSLRAIFGEESEQPSSWATKAMTGHILGASPLFQVVLTLEAMRHSFLPGSANGTNLDPACPLRLSTGLGVPKLMQTALCLNSGFWGNTSCIVLEKDKQS